jgi:flagellar basal-body rod protein FlgB
MASCSFNNEDPMSHPEITTEAVRLALGMHQLRAEYAGRNIANANVPGTQALRPDFAQTQRLLEEAAGVGSEDAFQVEQRLSAHRASDSVSLQAGGMAKNQVDEEVADMVGASLAYQTLSQSLSRYFGLMRLAVTGRG